MEKYLSYFNEMCKEDVEDVTTICDVASKEIYEKFKTKFDDPKLLAATFSKIYEAIEAKLKSYQSGENGYSDFQINLCDRLVIGYSTNDDDDDEKKGNFMIYLRHMNSNKKTEECDDPTATGEERAVQWNTDNIIDQPKIIAEISVAAVKAASDIDVRLGSQELVMPIFITTYENIVKYLKVRRKEMDKYELEINFVSCFVIGCRESEEEIDEIYIRPNIQSKLDIKDDHKATSVQE